MEKGIAQVNYVAHGSFSHNSSVMMNKLNIFYNIYWQFHKVYITFNTLYVKKLKVHKVFHLTNLNVLISILEISVQSKCMFCFLQTGVVEKDIWSMETVHKTGERC